MIRSFLITVLHSLRAVRLCVRFGVGLTGCMRSGWLPDRGVRAVAMKATVDGGYASAYRPPPVQPTDHPFRSSCIGFVVLYSLE